MKPHLVYRSLRTFRSVSTLDFRKASSRETLVFFVAQCRDIFRDKIVVNTTEILTFTYR